MVREVKIYNTIKEISSANQTKSIMINAIIIIIFSLGLLYIIVEFMGMRNENLFGKDFDQVVQNITNSVASNFKEGLDNMNSNGLDPSKRCPDVLLQKGSKYYLYNSKIAQVPGVNPIEFNTLEDYSEFLDWQHSVGIRCPVLYVQNTYNAQGERVYKVRPSATEPQGGLPPVTAVSLPLKFNELLVDAGREDPPYNKNGYPPYDQSSFYVGALTPLDTIKNSNANMLYSDSPMDPNWGGAKYTQALVDTGYYAGNEVSLFVP